jgi:hypothetical protein
LPVIVIGFYPVDSNGRTGAGALYDSGFYPDSETGSSSPPAFWGRQRLRERVSSFHGSPLVTRRWAVRRYAPAIAVYACRFVWLPSRCV